MNTDNRPVWGDRAPGAGRPWPLRRCCALAVLLGVALLAQERNRFAHAEDAPPAPTRSLEERSLPLRTALHHDPTLGAPLERLLEMYREARRTDELVDLYRAHVRSWPLDEGGRVVLIRLLGAARDPETTALARAALLTFPENGFLHWLLYLELDARADPRALESLVQAVRFAPDSLWRRRWIELLLPRALQEGRRDVALEQAQNFASLSDGTAQGLLGAAQTLARFGFPEQALALLEQASRLEAPPDLQVEIESSAATALAALDRRAEAAQRLDALLARLTSDHWRRADLLRRRARLAEETSSRDELLSAAKARIAAEPGQAAPILDLARLYVGFDRRREARELVLSAIEQQPASTELERLVIDLLDEERDEHGLDAFLAQRLARDPTRQDLAERRARSLLLLDRNEEGLALLEDALKEQTDAARLQRLVEMARALRGQSRLRSAMAVFERAVRLAPARADLRRELAESQLQAGQRSTARRLLSEPLPPETDPDAFLDLLGLLRRERFLPEALVQIEQRLRIFPRDLDLHLALLEIRARLGRFDGQGNLILGARQLADTGARYRHWFETALSAAELADGQAPFLQAEGARLSAESTDVQAREVDRVVAFAEGSAQVDEVGVAQTLLRDLLQRELPAESALRLRRALAQHLEGAARTVRGRMHMESAAHELMLLAEQDSEWSDTHRARLALLRAREDRHDLASTLSRGLDLSRIADPHLLERLRDLYIVLEDRDAALRSLERLVEVDSTQSDTWQDWLIALGATGDELRLRRAVRRLLAGVENLPLSADSQWELRAHLSDSCWRSVSATLDGGSRADFLDGLALLDQCDALMSIPAGDGWTLLARALLLERLADDGARDEVLGRLRAWLTERAQDPAASLQFPDGVAISADVARALLETRRSVQEPTVPAGQAKGPLRLERLAWRFEFTDTEVTAVLGLGPDALLIVTAAGSLVAVDAQTGRALWAQESLLPPARMEGPVHEGVLPLTTPDGDVLVPHVGGLTCLNAKGERRWMAAVGRPGPHVPRIFLSRGRVLAASATAGEAAAFDLATGRALWFTPLAPLLQEDSTQGGAVLDGERFFVYGQMGALLDARTGTLLWRFDPSQVRALPPLMDEPGRRPRRARWNPLALAVPALPPGMQVSHRGSTIFLTPGSPALPGMTVGGFQPQAPGLLGPLATGTPTTLPSSSTVSRSQRSLATWNPRATQVTPTAAGVAWASPLGPAEVRDAWMEGGTLYLARHAVGVSDAVPPQGSVLSVSLDLPLRVRATDSAATRLEVAPGVEWAESLLFRRSADLGVQRSVSLEALAPPEMRWVPTFAVDGPHLIVVGPLGILRINRFTLEQVDLSPWPAELGDVAWPQATALLHLTGGILGRDNAGRPLTHRPVVGLARPAMLVLIQSPGRVVALCEGAETQEPARGNR